jgi:hypothetical protein
MTDKSANGRHGRFQRGILLEGLTDVGKSELGKALLRLLELRGVPARYSHCWIRPNALNEAVHQRAFDSFDGARSENFPDPDLLRAFNVHRSAHVMMDSYLAIHTPPRLGDDAFLIQDRHWFSQLCHNEFFNPGEGFLSREWIATSAPTFGLHAYLTCSEASRAARAKMPREQPPHALRAYFRRHNDELHRFDEFSMTLIRDDPIWSIVSTDVDLPDELAVKLISDYEQRNGRIAVAATNRAS